MNIEILNAGEKWAVAVVNSGNANGRSTGGEPGKKQRGKWRKHSVSDAIGVTQKAF